ncbi:DNA primase [Acidaminococcus timonensis]|uniref:DNA primase n=1 Tax=Acidaminococcus timonensis TaxID=1871002 RepID=UPI00307A704B
MDDMKEKFANFKEQVRQAADLVSIVSETVTLKRKGSRYWGCCPFHEEKTPSFTVDPAKGLFHCFGCGAGGDVFSYVMKRDNLTFPEALKQLAGKYGIPVPERAKTAREIAREKETREVLEANELAARFFHSCLVNTQYGQLGIQYLAGRGIGRDIIDSFGLGMAPPDFTTLSRALEGRGVKEEVLLKAGLVNRRQTRGVYDKFRERVMIPIRDPRSRVVGFTGRILNKEASPAKYMNTGETAWFHKGNLLFGLDRAAPAIRKRQQALIVEGHMDAISLHATGVDWAVASMGTAFTEHQAALLKRLTPEVVFCFDSDRAGRAAAMRAIPLALRAGLKCRVMHVTDGKDPDEFIRKEGRVAFEELLKNAKPGMDYQVDSTLAACDTETLGGKVEAVARVLPFFLDCTSDVEVGERIRDLARRLSIDEGLIQSEYRKLTHQDGKQKPLNPEWLTQKQVKLTSPTEQAERLVLRAFLEGIPPQPGQEGIASLATFTTPARQEIFRAFLQAVQQGTLQDPRDLFASLGQEAQTELTRILSLNVQTETLPSILTDCLNRLQVAALDKEYEKHSQLAEKYEKEGNEKFLQELEECRRIKMEIGKLANPVQ